MEVNEVHRPGFHGGYKAQVLRPRPLLLQAAFNPLLALRLRQLRLQQQLAGSLYGGLGGLGVGLGVGLGGGLGGVSLGGHYGGGLFSGGHLGGLASNTGGLGGLGGHYGGGLGFGGFSGPSHHHDNEFNQGGYFNQNLRRLREALSEKNTLPSLSFPLHRPLPMHTIGHFFTFSQREHFVFVCSLKTDRK